MRSAILILVLCLPGCVDLSRPDAVVDYERLGNQGYIWTARHRGHVYAGAVVHQGVTMLHSPECECHKAAEVGR